jgi:hypothetical protein
MVVLNLPILRKTVIKMNLPSKHIQIEKANSRIFTVAAIASVVIIFSLLSAKTLLSQVNHQRHVIGARNDAVKQLKKNIEVAGSLESFFSAFNTATPNIIGGNPDNSATGPSDGDSARITLDALPSVYDYPALVTSLEKILKNEQLTNIEITGVDQSGTFSNDPLTNPTPQLVEVTISGTGNYVSLQNVIKDLERSIRPFDLVTFKLEGSESKLKMTAKLNTYYQQSKSLDYTTKEVK